MNSEKVLLVDGGLTPALAALSAVPNSEAQAVLDKLPTRQDEVPDRLRTTPLTCTIKMPGAVHIVECGHKFDPREQPRNNCGYCWGVYWRLHPAEVAAGASIINAYGKEPIIKSRGEKYFKALKKAVEAYEWQKQQEQLTKLTVTPETTDPTPAQ